MKKQVNEASVRIDVQGLESNDLETLSRMLALAGQAENKGPQLGGMTSIPAIAPLDIDNIGGADETQPIMSPDMAPSADDMSGAGEDALGAAVDDLAGSVTDFGDQGLDNDLGGDVQSMGMGDESPELSGDDDFDMDRMSSLAGIHESQDVDEADNIPTDDADDVNPDDQETDTSSIGESLLPDLSLDEDSVASTSDQEADKEYGPFRTEHECVIDGQQKTNGFEGDNFIVVPKGNAFYWKRTVQEDAENRPDPDFYDDDGIRNSRHVYKDKQPGTALGDNPIIGENDEDDESVDSIFESITDKYKKFMEGL
jgi:hypothetical protein